MSIRIIYVTFPDEASALALGQAVVTSRLAACFNLHSVRSVYTWKEKLEDGVEWIALFKTRSSHESALRNAIEKGHPYEVPCILGWDATVNDIYGAWVDECLCKPNSNLPADEQEARP